jgi:hypothetical protein
MPATQADTVFGIVAHYTRGRKLIGRHFSNNWFFCIETSKL